jgi:hypothetical protein
VCVCVCVCVCDYIGQMKGSTEKARQNRDCLGMSEGRASGGKGAASSKAILQDAKKPV